MVDALNNADILTENGISKALELVRLRIKEAERGRKEAEEAEAVAREEERLLNRLLVLRRGGQSEPAQDTNSESENVARNRRFSAIAAVIEELAAAGRPVHVSELMRLLGTRNVSIPGAGKQANLIAHMSRDKRIVRPSRGMYALAMWGLENMPAKSTMRRRRKRVRISAERNSK
jgi:hypothetical protein